MKPILSPGQNWYGRPVRALPAHNRRPVALADSYSLVQGVQSISMVVLANDFDPEGGSLDVISATADFGSTVIEPDNSISYTPPPGFIGNDTITYVIEDDQGLTHTGAAIVAVNAPELTIDVEANNTLTVNAELGTISITVVSPAELAGTYQAQTADLDTGPVNLRPPAITGTEGIGQVLSASDGLWIYDPSEGGAPSQSWQWYRNGGAISGATTNSYTLTAADIGQVLSVDETLSQASGSRSATGLLEGTSFQPSQDSQAFAWWDSADLATITTSGNSVSSWVDKTGGAALLQTFAPQQPESGTRTLNGLNTIDFAGGQHLAVARNFPASGDMSIHMVVEIDSISNLYEAVLAIEATNDFQVDAGSSLQFDGRLNPSGIGSMTNLSGGPFSGAIILSLIFDRTGAGQCNVFINDTLRGTMTYNTNPIDSSAALHIMANRSLNAWVTGAVAEVVMTEDTSNRALYQSYLSNKWGFS